MLDKAMFRGLPPGRPAGCEIEVIFSYDLNERMHCVFRDVQSGKQYEATLKPKGVEDISVDQAALRDFIVE